MQINVSTNEKKVRASLKKKGKDVDASIKKALSITAQVGVNIIEDRTERGKGYKAGFKPYSKAYKQFRRNKGRGAKPDLNFTGKMLGSMTTKASKKKANIFFTRATEAKKAAMNDKTRPFFGFSRKERNKLGEVFFRYIK